MNHDSFAFTPGQQLAAARKARGLKLSDIAERTKILESRLAAIERDDYGAAGVAQPYVTGYVKSYAKQVGVPAAPMIKTLNAYYAQRDRAELEEREAGVVEKNGVPVKVYAILFVVLLSLGGYALYIAKQEHTAEPQTAPLSTSSAMDDQYLDDRSDIPTLKTNKPANQNDSMDMKVTQDAGRFDRVFPGDKASYAQESEIDTDESTSDQLAGGIGQDSGLTKIDTVINTDARADTEIVNGAGSDELFLQFDQDCWLDIRDASGKQLLMRLAKAGESFRVNGEAPFDLKLGNAFGATVIVNGREVDVTPPPGRKVLSLQLGP